MWVSRGGFVGNVEEFLGEICVVKWDYIWGGDMWIGDDRLFVKLGVGDYIDSRL